MYHVTLEEVPCGGGLEAGYGHNRFPDVSVMLLNLSSSLSYCTPPPSDTGSLYWAYHPPWQFGQWWVGGGTQFLVCSTGSKHQLGWTYPSNLLTSMLCKTHSDFPPHQKVQLILRTATVVNGEFGQNHLTEDNDFILMRCSCVLQHPSKISIQCIPCPA